MKIKPEHLAILQTKINAVLELHPTAVEKYEAGHFPRADKVKDLQRRFCWDLLWAAMSNDRDFVMDTLYSYLNDDHVNTALKRICPTVIKRY